MTDSKRQDIIDALDTLLKTIKTTAGYETNIGSYVKEYDETDATQTDTLKLTHRDIGQTSEEADFEGYLHNLNVILEIQVIGTISTMRKVIADVTKAIGTSRTLGGLALDFLPPRDQIKAEHEDKFIVEALMQLTIQYETAAFNPYT